MNLSFYDSLSENQKAFANKIAQRAKAMGIPPELAVSIAYRESGLNPSVQPGMLGEIGIMQIKPGTAKEMGFSIDDIKNPEKNIDAGLSYLKRSLDLSDGDTRLAAAGYNAGVNHEFFKNEKSKLPDTTVNYLQDLKGYGAFQNPVVSRVEPAEEPHPEAEKVMEDIGQGRAEQLGQIAGGAAGTALTAARTAVPLAKGSAALAGKILSPAARQAVELMGGQRGVPGAQPPIGGGAAAGLAEDATAVNRILQGTTDPTAGTTGRARMTGFNTQTGQTAALAEQQARNIGALRQAGTVGQTAEQLFANAPGLTSSPSGVLYPRSPAVGVNVGALPEPVAPPPTPSRGALEEVKTLFNKMMGPSSMAGKAIRYVAPPLAGMQMGSDIGTALTEVQRKEPDYTKAGLAGLGALGAGMSMFLPTAPIGIPLAVGAPLAQMYREKTQGALPVTTETVAP